MPPAYPPDPRAFMSNILDRIVAYKRQEVAAARERVHEVELEQCALRAPPARDFRAGLTFLGITPSPAFVGEPEGNGVAERAFRTIKEQCLYLHRFQTLEEARQVIGEFIARYNEQWLVAKLGYRPPAVARRDWQDRAA